MYPVLTLCQLLPQIIKTYRRHSSDGLHPIMYLSWAVAGIPLGTYNLVQNLNIALQVQAHILIFLSLVTWSQCAYYGDKWPISRIALVGLGVGVVIGGVEAGLLFALRHARNQGIEWPMTLMAVLAAVLLAIGVLRYYWEIYKNRDVRGISFMFVFIDFAGDITSIVALVFAPHIDVVGMVVYSVEAVLWIGIMLLGVHFRLRAWMLKRLRSKSTSETSECQATVEIA
jgi:uncharacterized protein with PQ loop repeat